MDPAERARVVAALERFADSGRGDLDRVAGTTDPPEHRLRVGGWRVRLELDEPAGELRVLRVLPRGQAYRRG